MDHKQMLITQKHKTSGRTCNTSLDLPILRLFMRIFHCFGFVAWLCEW